MRGGAPGRRTLEERLARKTVVAKASHLVPDACHLWQGARVSGLHGGYGLIKIGGTAANPTYVHRLVYEREVGPIPDGLVPDHVCEIRNCINPAHIQLVTPAENVRLGFQRRRADGRPLHRRRRAA